MTKSDLISWWDHFVTINGITMRVIQAIPGDTIDTRPCKDMRTPKELVGHMYSSMKELAEGTARGELRDTEEADAAATAKIKTHDELVRFAKESWNAADKAIRSLSEAQVTALVKSPWGKSFPGYVCVNIIYDEHLHHRGQLYAYLRQMGVTPPMMWDFEGNAAEFKPRQPQQV
jgi:uncharacterized damage-inducible protein DinB